MQRRFSGNAFPGARRYVVNTAWKTKWLYARRFFVRRWRPWVPRQLWIGVTYRCQCRCVHCFLGPELNRDQNELSREEVSRLIVSAKRLGFLEVVYFGGEPLLREDIADLVQLGSAQGLLTSLYTNGLGLTKEKVEELRAAGLHFCNVSLDSPSPRQHNELRGHKECFEKAVEGIQYVRDAGIKCSIWTYVNKEDVESYHLKDLKALIALGRRLNVWKVVILFPMASGNWLCGAEHLLTASEKAEVRALHQPPFTAMEFPREEMLCMAGKRLIYITPRGDVSPCPTVPYFVGNIREDSLQTVLQECNFAVSDAGVDDCGDCVMNASSFREKIGFTGISPSDRRGRGPKS